MASSNKHWPSMFKSKPCNNPHHQWQHNDHLLPSAGCHRTPYSSGPGCEERTPEPKPRWNPKPEQIRILEAIFNSGMVNPPREEIRKIRVQLQEYGQVGDANVFYWFQNRKSRSKHKQRQQIQNAKSQPQQTATPPPQPPVSAPVSNAAAFVATAAGLSSSSSSDKSSPNNSNEKHISLGPSIADLLNSPSANSVNQQQPFLQPPADFLPETFLFPVQTTNPVGGSSLPGFWSFDVPNIVDQGLENCPNYHLLNELMLMDQFPLKKDDDIEKMKVQQNLGFPAQTMAPPSIPISNQISQGVGMAGQAPTRSTVFINDVCFEVAPVPLNVRETFGEDVVLVHSSGQAVLTNGWGETLQPLQHGGVYYLLHPFAPSDRTIDLIW